MKNMRKLVVTSLMICFGILHGIAGVENPFSVSTDENNFIVLNIDDVAQREVNISLVDRRGSVIFTEEIQNTKIKSRKYDLGNLENGDYSFQVDYDTVIKIQRITKTNNKVTLIPSDQKTVIKPSISNKAGKVDVNILSFNGKFEIKIMDMEGDIIYSEKHEATGPFHRRFNLTELSEGNYRFKVDLDTKNYEGSFQEIVEIQSALASL